MRMFRAIAATVLIGAVCYAADRGGAVVEVKGSRRLALATFAEKVVMHPNRGYCFLDVPPCLLGLQFTAHEHKAPAAVSGTVVTAGLVYVCAEAGLTLESLGLDAGTWRRVGTVNAFAANRKYPFNVYEGRVLGDQAIALPVRDRWGVILAAKEIRGLAKFVPVAETTKPAGPAPASDEFGLLQQQLAARRPEDKVYRDAQALLAKQTLRREALLRESDRDPLDVVLRRTAALRAHLSARGAKLDG